MSPLPRSLNGLKILIAEDNLISQKVLARLLRGMGAHVHVTDNGLEALELLSKSSYDLLLLDCQLPKMDGYAAACAIKQEPAKYGRMPILAMTAHANESDRERCLEAGMDDYLLKPLQPDPFFKAIHRWCGRLYNAPTEEIQTIDPSPLQTLASLGQSATFVEELITFFEKSVPEHFARMHEALANNNLQELQAEAHRFKTSCGSLGARQMVEFCQKIEDCVDGGSHGTARELLAQLSEKFPQTLADLRSWVPKLG